MRFSIRHCTCFAALAGFLAAAPAWGQGIGGQTSGMGTTSGIGSSGIGSSGIGSSGIGSSGIGSSGFGSTSGFGSQSTSGQSSSGFIGRDSSDVTTMFENMTRQATGSGRAGQTRNSQRSDRTSSAQRNKQPLRVQIKVTFDHPNMLSPQLVTAENTKMNELLAEREVSAVTLVREEGRVVLGGTATSEWERKVAEKLVALQPGVRTVTNQMTVAEPIPTSTPQQ